MAVSPDLYWVLSRSAGRKLLAHVSPFLMTSLTPLQECMFSQLVGSIIENSGSVPLFTSFMNVLRLTSLLLQ